MAEKKGPNDKNGSGDSRARIVTVYDRLEEARARREKALSKRPPAPAKATPAPLLREPNAAEREKGATMTAVVSSLKATSGRAETPKAPASTYAAPPPSAKPRRKRVLALGAVPVMVGIAAVALPLPTSEMPPVQETQIATVAPVEGVRAAADAPNTSQATEVARNLSIGPSVSTIGPEDLSLVSADAGLGDVITPGVVEPVRTASIAPEFGGTADLMAGLAPPTSPVVRDVPELGPDVVLGLEDLINWRADEGPTVLAAALPAEVSASPARIDVSDGLFAVVIDAQPSETDPLPAAFSIWSGLEAPTDISPESEANVTIASLGSAIPGFETPTGLLAAPRPGGLSETVLASLAPPAALDLPPFSEAEDAAMRVVLHIPDQVGDARVTELVEAAQASGLTVDRLVRTPFNVSGTNIRYYHHTDTAPAEALADALGARARDFTSFSPLPDEGLIEIYAEGKSKPRPRVTHTPPPQAVATVEQPKRYRVIRIIKPKRTFNPFRRDRDDDGGRVVEVVTMSSPPAPGTTIADIFEAAKENNAGDDGSTGDDGPVTGGDDDSTGGGDDGPTGDGDPASSGDGTSGDGDPTTGGDDGSAGGDDTTGGGEPTGGDTGGDDASGGGGSTSGDDGPGGGTSDGGGSSGGDDGGSSSSSDDGGSSSGGGGSSDDGGSSGSGGGSSSDDAGATAN